MANVCVAGVGTTEFHGDPERSVLELAPITADRAVADAEYTLADGGSVYVGNVLAEDRSVSSAGRIRGTH